MTASSVKQQLLAEHSPPLASEKSGSQTVEIPAGRGEPAKTVTLHDEYAWIRGKNWPSSRIDEPEILEYLEAENTYCKDFLASLKDHQDKFFETLKGRIKLADTTIEVKKGDYVYYSRTYEEKQYSVDCRRQGPNAEEEIILDRNALAEGKKFSKVLGSVVSSNHKLMGYKSDYVGDEAYKLQFQKLDGSKEFLKEEMENVGGFCFHEALTVPKENEEPVVDAAADPVGVFYSVRNAQLRPTKIFYHKFGTPVSEDPLVFESKNDMFTVSCYRSSDKRFALMNYHSKTEVEVRALDLMAFDSGKTLAEQLAVVRPLSDNIEYSADHGGNAWFLKTKEGCSREHFRILIKRDGVDADFRVLLDEHPELCLNSSFLLTKNRFALSFLSTKNGQPRLLEFTHSQAADAGSKPLTVEDGVLLKFPGVDPEATSHDAVFSGASSYTEDRLVAAVDTPVRPTEWFLLQYHIFCGYILLVGILEPTDSIVCNLLVLLIESRNVHSRYDFTTSSAPTLVKQKEVPNFNPELYATERVYVQYQEDRVAALHPSEEAVNGDAKPAEAASVQIPVTLLYKKDALQRDGSMPLLLNGYGSYGIAEEPIWSNLDTLYADLGFVVATAHIRGGGDLGEPWYQAAKFLKKKRTFLDFIACADYLADKKWTSKGNIAICGGSAGGMLVGACLNMRPDLFRAVVAHVPFVTVLDTMLDGELPLTPGEFKEWGNPRDSGFFDYMRSYCPYENVAGVFERSDNFPNIFATAGLTDYRVGYYEAAKWIARLRKEVAKTKSSKPKNFKEPLIVFETNMAAGHAGASGRFDRLKEKSRDVAFLATEFGLLE